MKNTTQTVKALTTISRERLITKIWRTLVGVGIGVVLYFVELDAGVEKWGWILVGVLVAGEWVLFPIRLLASAAQDVAAAIVALKKAWRNGG